MTPSENSDTKGQWVQLCWISLAVFLSLSLWFSASAIGRPLQRAWGLTNGQLPWLTIAVQLGFVAGTLVSALLNLPDRLRAERLLAMCALLGGITNALIPLLANGPEDFVMACGLRFLTGVALAGVYPPGMKLIASWFKTRRGFSIGVMVGALTLGSALPHLLLALSTESGSTSATVTQWQVLMWGVSAAAAVAALLAGLFVRPGPYLGSSVRFNWHYVVTIWKDRPLRQANFGYLGHMWELYAVWTWVPLFLADSFSRGGYSLTSGRLAGFSIIAIGALSCVVAGWIADRAGRTNATIGSLLVSGGCCLIAGYLAEQPILLLAVCLVWGALVIADSAQYSAAISELCDPQLVGTALTIQTCAGFLLTTLSIGLLPVIQEWLSPAAAFSILAFGPAFGIYHMWKLKLSPAAQRLAGGRG